MRPNRNPIDDLARIDPVDGDRLAAFWSKSEAKHAVIEEIATMSVDTSETRTDSTQQPELAGRPGRMLRLVAGIAAVAMALVLAPGVFTEGDQAFAVRQLPNGVIEVDASPQFRDGDALAAELGEFGIDVEITTVPSSPSLVGEVEVFAPGGGEYIPEGISFGADGTADVFRLQIDPALFKEELVLRIYAAAENGEPYEAATSVFQPGEVLGGLHCALGEPLRAELVAPYLADLGLTATWTLITPTGDPSITNSEPVRAVPSGVILSGFARDASTVEFEVQGDGVILPDIYGAFYADQPCSAEQAASWN